MTKLNRQRILSHLTDKEDTLVMARILDKVEETLSSHRPTVTDFLAPYHQELATDILKGIRDIQFQLTGGLPEAERQRLLIINDYHDFNAVTTEIAILEIKGNFAFVRVTHRDFLGSILGTGLKREKVGDIFPVSTGCYVVCDQQAAQVITSQLTQVHQVKIEVTQVEPGQVMLPQDELKIIETTVPSTRLDVLLAAGFGLSRARAIDLIKSQRVKVNWRPGMKAGDDLAPGDLISARGLGRLRLVEQKGLTKKGRIVVVLERRK